MNQKNNFDKQIKQKLDGLQSYPEFGSWESFQSKMDSVSDHAGYSPEDFDGRVKNKLHKLQPEFQSVHWEKLRYKLETIELFRRKIFIHKAKEMLAVFLFLFTFYNLGIYQADWITSDEEIYVSLNPSSNHWPLVESALKPEIAKVRGAVPDRNVRTKTPVQTQRLNSKESIVISDQDHRSNVRFLSDPVKMDAIQPSPEGFISIPLTTEEPESQQSLLPLSSSSTEPYSLYATIIPMSIQQGKSTRRWNSVGIHFGHVDNFILSPFDKVYSIPKFSNSTRNQSYGISYGKRSNHWEVETGISFSRLRYKPAEVREIYGNTGEISFETSLQKIQFDLWKVPFSLKYFIVDKPSWKYYALVGSSLNVISDATYTIEENIVLGRPLAPTSFTHDGPRLEQKPFNNGVFEDGTFKYNYYVDVFFGMGIEKSISKFTSVYLQPGYHAFLFSEGIGIGPNNDKINAFHLQTGLKFYFTK